MTKPADPFAIWRQRNESLLASVTEDERRLWLAATSAVMLFPQQFGRGHWHEVMAQIFDWQRRNLSLEAIEAEAAEHAALMAGHFAANREATLAGVAKAKSSPIKSQATLDLLSAIADL